MKPRYNIIYADPPWSYGVWKDHASISMADSHYPTMSLSDICALPVSQLAAEDCVLFLWTTPPLLREAFEVIEAWEFSYVTMGFTWVKQHSSGLGFSFGLGHWTRGNPEYCLLAGVGSRGG